MTEAEQIASEALREVRELAALIRRALPGVESAVRSVGELWAWWSAEYLPRMGHDRKSIAQRWRDYLLPELEKLSPEELFPARIETLLANLPARLSPRSVAAVRYDLFRAIEAARANGRWVGINPVAAVRAPSIPRKVRATLSATELGQLLEHARPAYRSLWAVAGLLGLRPGEIYALRRSDVDLSAGALLVARSHERAATKTGSPRVLPITATLAPFLREQLRKRAGAQLVFPAKSGAMRGRRDRLTDRLRADLARAGISRSMRAYDLRHTFATLARQAGAHPHAVSAVLGHAPSISALYDEWDLSALRRELDKLRLPSGKP